MKWLICKVTAFLVGTTILQSTKMCFIFNYVHFQTMLTLYAVCLLYEAFTSQLCGPANTLYPGHTQNSVNVTTEAAE